jgi:hypothetical protein
MSDETMTWWQILRGKLLCVLARIIAIFTLIVFFIPAPIVRADHTPAHVPNPSTGGTFLNAGEGKVYQWCAPNCTVYRNGQPVTTFQPLRGEVYVRDRVYQDAVKFGASKTAAIKAATVPMSNAQVANYLGKAASVGKASLSLGKSLAGAAGSGLLFIPDAVLREFGYKEEVNE